MPFCGEVITYLWDCPEEERCCDVLEIVSERKGVHPTFVNNVKKGGTPDGTSMDE